VSENQAAYPIAAMCRLLGVSPRANECHSLAGTHPQPIENRAGLDDAGFIK
jgi:hypothetical protein